MARPIAIAISSSETFPYVLEANREDPVSEQTVFQLRPPTVAEDESYLNSAGVLGKVGTKAHSMLRKHLKGWSNLVGADGEEIAFDADSKGKPSDAAIEALPISVRIELMNAITTRGRDTDTEEVKGK